MVQLPRISQLGRVQVLDVVVSLLDLALSGPGKEKKIPICERPISNSDGLGSREIRREWFWKDGKVGQQARKKSNHPKEWVECEKSPN